LAYRRATENNAGARLASDPEMGRRVTISNRDVQVSNGGSKRAGDATFDPKTWQPAAADKQTALRFSGKKPASTAPSGP
jgi:hypothetical protein